MKLLLALFLSFATFAQVPAVNSGTATYPTSGTICITTVCAPIASPTFTGTPAAPTPAATDNSTTIPTTAYVTTAIANAVSAAAGRDLVAAATAAVLPNTPNFTHVDAGIGSFYTSSTNSVLVVDGYTPLLLDRILVKNQGTAAQNGIYSVTQLGVASVTPWILTRTLDYDQASDMNNTIVPVANHGTANPLTSWIMTSTVATVDTDAVNFAAFTPSGANIVTAVSPGVGLCHFAGSTQACTSSAVVNADITNTTIDLTTKVTNLLPAANIVANVRVRSLGATFNNTQGTALTAGATTYFTVPFSCTIAAWNVMVSPADTATIDIWKIATGTAIPTVANTIVASAAPAISTGTAIHSTTLTGWTTAVAANDIVGINLKTVGGTATTATLNVECDQ